MNSLLNLRFLALAVCALYCFLPGILAAQEIEFDEEFPAPLMSELAADLEKQARAAPPDTTDPQQLCIFHHQQGLVNFRLGNYDQAIRNLRQALELNRPNRLSPDQWCERWRILMDLKSTYEAAGDWISALELINTTITDEARNRPLRQFLAQTMLITPYLRLGRESKADMALKEAERLLPQLHRQKGWGQREHYILSVYYRASAQLQALNGNHRKEEESWRLALDHASRHGAARQARFGEKAQATRAARDNQRFNQLGLAGSLIIQGKLGEAEYFARQALRETLAYYTLNTTKAASVLTILARIKLESGDLKAAEKLYRTAIAALEQPSVKPYSTSLAALRGQLGFVLCAQERWDEAIKVFEQRDSGLRSNPEQFNQLRSNHIEWAMALHRTGRSDKAENMLRRILKRGSTSSFSAPNFIAQLKGYLAVVLAAEGKREEALSLFREALPALVKRAQEEEEDENGGFTRTYRLKAILDAYLELLGELHGKRPAEKAALATEAFIVSDHARMSTVQRAMVASLARARLPDPSLAELARREQDISYRLQALQKLLMEVAAVSNTTQLEQDISGVRGEIGHLENQRKSLMAEILLAFPAYAELLEPQPPSLLSVQQSLKENEATVAIHVGEQHSFVWTITPAKTGFRVVDLSRKQLSLYVAALRQGLEFRDGRAKGFDLALAYQIYHKLLAPDADMWSTAKLVNFIPHGPLAQIPFALLLTRQPTTGPASSYRDRDWLIKQAAIAQQPSASAFLALRKAVAGEKTDQLPLIGFGNPLFGGQPRKADGPTGRGLRLMPAQDDTLTLIDEALQGVKPDEAQKVGQTHPLAYAFQLLADLPDTAEELLEIARVTHANARRDLFMQENASEKKVKSTPLTKYRVVAFATHGLTPGELPGLDQPALALANPQLAKDPENDGFLTMDEVLGLKLNAEWVVLSACNTAGADGKGSEAVSGIGRSFFYAGARSLLVSNWAVESTSARLLTTRIFTLQAEQPSLGRAEALRQAMIALMNTSQAEGDYSHPVFWAPFSLIGDGLK